MFHSGGARDTAVEGVFIPVKEPVKGNIMKKFGVLLVACVALSLSSCSGPKEKIIGKWEYTKKEGDIESKITMDFKKDGNFTMGMEAGPLKMNVDGKYKWVDNDHIEITFKVPGGKEEKTEKLKVVKVDDKELQLEGKMGAGDKTETTTFTKAK